MKKISIILISIVLLLLASSCDGQVFSELMDQTTENDSTPLTLEFIADGELSFTNRRDSLQYSINGGARTNAPDSIDVKANDIVRLYAEAAEQSESSYLKINCTSDCYVYGNVMSLLDPDNFATKITIANSYALYGLFRGNTYIQNHETKKLILPATTLANYCYAYMFYGCKGLTEAPELPATTLADNCYERMFAVCTGLTEAPELPATTLANNCYAYMFSGCTGLTQAPELPAKTLADYCYYSMISGCTGLTEAPDLPAKTLAENCYRSMFSGCTGLTEAPELPATTLVDYCYSFMFHGCTGLTQAPELPATTLANFCYLCMFYGCTALNEAPELPATTLAEGCYTQMFYNCENLSSITCLATDISASNCTNSWLNGVAATGAFTKASNMTGWPTDSSSGIPSGWTIDDPLTLKFIADGKLSFTNRRDSLQYSINGEEKTNAPDSIDVKANDIVRLYAEGADQDYFNYFTINCTSECYVYGNVMSLLDPVYYATNKTITKSYALNGLFKGNTYIKNHATKKLILPATTLANYCYFMMFYGCTGLTEAPELPATTLANNCYQRMFHGCTGLTKAPELLPATTLAVACYSGMFSGCTSLTKAPELPATALAESCYSEMFSNCANLSSITCLATDISASNCTTYWVNGVSSTGTFTKAPDTNWPRTVSGIPSGWTVEDKQ